MKILYIEDNHDLAETVVEFLEKDGHEIMWVDNRQKLPADVSPFDFVISDFNVPGGEFQQTKEVCEAFRKPLLLVTGNWSANTDHKDIIHKPFSPKDLTKTIEQIISRKAK